VRARCVSGLLFWVLSCVLFLMAVASLVFSALVRDHENRYLFWVGVVTWAVLCLALALVVKAGFL
jgi:Na+/melibiose symporter-like transporter